MRALVYTAPRRLEVLEISDPVPGAGEVLIRVRAAGVCGSDLHGFLGRSRKRVPPLILGHEFSGEVVANESHSRVSCGDAVAVYPIIGCGSCLYCASNREYLCPARRVYGLDFHGALAEFVTAPAACVFPVPGCLSFLEAALVEPLANAIHVLRSCGDVSGRTGLVYGAGPIGMLCAFASKQRGAGRVAVVDRNPHRLPPMKVLGVDTTVDASRTDPMAAIREWTGGSGVDFAIDAVGNTECRRNCIACTASGGTVMCIGLEDEICAVDTRPVVTRELSVKGTYAYSRPDFAEAISMLEQKLLPWEPLVTRTQLANGQAIFEDLASGCSRILKTVFEM